MPDYDDSFLTDCGKLEKRRLRSYSFNKNSYSDLSPIRYFFKNHANYSFGSGSDSHSRNSGIVNISSNSMTGGSRHNIDKRRSFYNLLREDDNNNYVNSSTSIRKFN